VNYLERSIENLEWITIILVSCFCLLAILKVVHPKRFGEFILLPMSNKYFLVQGKNDLLTHPFNVILFIIQIANVSLLIYLIVKPPENNSFIFYVYIVLFYSVFMIVKMLLEKIVGTLFSIETLINKYLYHKLTYLNLFSLLLFILNIFIFYLIEPSKSIIIIIGLSFFVLNLIYIIYSYKKYRSLIFGNFFYFILYLCALEISPLLLLYTVIE
jgi:hypothetical protein